MKKRIPSSFLKILSLLLLAVPLELAQAFDVEAFFAENFVVDGLGTYYDSRPGTEGHPHPYPSPEGPWDFGPLKKETGANLIVMSYRTQQSFELQSRRFGEGLYLNSRLIRSFGDIIQIRETGEFGVLMYVQMPYRLNGSASTVASFHAKGLRVFQLAYGTQHTGQDPRDVLAHGSDQSGGVTALGEQVIAELNRLQMVVDVSHCNEQSVIDDCRLSRAPVVCTHAGARSVTDTRRNHTDRAIRAIVETGGIFGITAVGWIIENPKTKERGVPEFCDHVDHVRQLVGIEHVAVSTDSPLHGWDRLSPHRTSPELSHIGHWKAVAVELHRRGYTEEDLQRLFGLNFVTVFKKVLVP